MPMYLTDGKHNDMETERSKSDSGRRSPYRVYFRYVTGVRGSML
jgi:hypothetical protein